MSVTYLHCAFGTIHCWKAGAQGTGGTWTKESRAGIHRHEAPISRSFGHCTLYLQFLSSTKSIKLSSHHAFQDAFQDAFRNVIRISAANNRFASHVLPGSYFLTSLLVKLMRMFHSLTGSLQVVRNSSQPWCMHSCGSISYKLAVTNPSCTSRFDPFSIHIISSSASTWCLGAHGVHLGIPANLEAVHRTCA